MNNQGETKTIMSNDNQNNTTPVISIAKKTATKPAPQRRNRPPRMITSAEVAAEIATWPDPAVERVLKRMNRRMKTDGVDGRISTHVVRGTDGRRAGRVFAFVYQGKVEESGGSEILTPHIEAFMDSYGIRPLVEIEVAS